MQKENGCRSESEDGFFAAVPWSVCGVQKEQYGTENNKYFKLRC